MLLVAKHDDRDGESYFMCGTLEDVMENDGPTIVGTYKLIETRKIVKKLTTLSTKKTS